MLSIRDSGEKRILEVTHLNKETTRTSRYYIFLSVAQRDHASRHDPLTLADIAY
jgi:hypothetical protein